MRVQDELSARAPYQVLVIVFRRNKGCLEYLLLKRADTALWQWVAGGGEADEVPLQAAIRELREETGIEACDLMPLDSETRIPVVDVTGGFTWGHEVLVIPEYAFACEVAEDASVKLSSEHTECKWAGYEEAMRLLNWDSSKTALWETNQRALSENPS